MSLVFWPCVFIDQEPFSRQRRPVALKSANGSFLDPFPETLLRSHSEILFQSFVDEPASVPLPATRSMRRTVDSGNVILMRLYIVLDSFQELGTHTGNTHCQLHTSAWDDCRL